jgi:hypothetical protein
MELNQKFTVEEDDYLRRSVEKGVRVSRMAVRLNRPYYAVQGRLVKLELIAEKDVRNSKFCSDDEIDYELLKSGNSEEDLAKIHGTSRIFSIQHSQSAMSEDE